MLKGMIDQVDQKEARFRVNQNYFFSRKDPNGRWILGFRRTACLRARQPWIKCVSYGLTQAEQKKKDTVNSNSLDYFDDTPGDRYRDEFFGPEFDLDRQKN